MSENSVNDLGQPVGRRMPHWSPRPRPEPIVLTGRYCRLEPLSPHHVDDLHAALNGDPLPGQWTYMLFGPFATRPEFAAHVRRLIGNPGLRNFAIVDAKTQRPAGMAAYDGIQPLTGCIELGCLVYGRSLRRSPGGTEALYMMAAHAFDDLGYRRVQWRCDALNAISRAAATRLGFRYEGTWRNASVCKGRNRDTAWFAMTDTDWDRTGPLIAGWLHPDNFDADGRQRTALSALVASHDRPEI